MFDSGVYEKVMHLIGFDRDLWGRIPIPVLVSHILEGVGRLSPSQRICPDHICNKCIVGGLSLMCRIAEFRCPGILKTLHDNSGKNLLVQVFARFGIPEMLDGFSQYGRSLCSPDNVIKMFEETGLDVFVELLVFDLGFPKDTKIDEKWTLLDILDESGFETLEKSWKARISVDAHA